MMDFIEDHAGFVVGALVMAALIGIGAGIYHDVKAENQFMTDCLKDHKQYECTAMWRAGESHVVPMPIVIPTR